MAQTILEFIKTEDDNNKAKRIEANKPFTDLMKHMIDTKYATKEKQKARTQDITDYDQRYFLETGKHLEFPDNVTPSQYFQGKLEKYRRDNNKVPPRTRGGELTKDGKKYKIEETWDPIEGKWKESNRNEVMQEVTPEAEYLAGIGYTNVPEVKIKDIVARHDTAAEAVDIFNSTPEYEQIEAIFTTNGGEFRQVIDGQKSGKDEVWVRVEKKGDVKVKKGEDAGEWKLVSLEDISDYTDYSEQDIGDYIEAKSKYEKAIVDLNRLKARYGAKGEDTVVEGKEGKEVVDDQVDVAAGPKLEAYLNLEAQAAGRELTDAEIKQKTIDFHKRTMDTSNVSTVIESKVDPKKVEEDLARRSEDTAKIITEFNVKNEYKQVRENISIPKDIYKKYDKGYKEKEDAKKKIEDLLYNISILKDKLDKEEKYVKKWIGRNNQYKYGWAVQKEKEIPKLQEEIVGKIREYEAIIEKYDQDKKEKEVPDTELKELK